MFEIIKSGGWLMAPIIACSIMALAIVAERLWTLRRKRVMPDQLVAQIWQWRQSGQLTIERIRQVREGSPLGRVLITGILNRDLERQAMKEKIEETGRAVAHELERYLNTLGTIAAISPLLGLLGTVIGMIQIFSVINEVGVGDAGQLAGGISVALITTAAGLIVAIPSLFFHRYFRGRVDQLVVNMEQETIKLVEVMLGERRRRETTRPEAA